MNTDSDQQHHWRVLIIDDEQSVAASHALVLSPPQPKSDEKELDQLIYGGQESVAVTPASAPKFDCDIAIDGESGLELVVEANRSRRPYAVACIDMRMPNGWDGLKTAREIRVVDQQIHIIFVTAWMDYSLEEIRQQIGLKFNFLSKPVRRSEFLQLVTFSAYAWSDSVRVVEDTERLEQYHQQVTHSLALEKEHIELVFEAMNEAVVMVDQLGNVEGFNAKLSRMTGWEEEEMAGQPLEALFVGREKASSSHSSGLHVDTSSINYERMQLLLHSLERWIDASLLAVMRVSAEGVIEQSNYAMEVLSGWSAEQLVGGSLEPLLPEKMRGHHQQLVKQFVNEPEVRRMGGERILPLVCSDGRVKSVEIALLPLGYQGEEIVLAVLHDPSEQQKLDLFRITPFGSLFVENASEEGVETDWELRCKKSEPIPVHVTASPVYRDWEGRRRFNGAVLVLRDLRKLIEAEAAERAGKAKDDFLASMSHELRTPLASIIGNSELLCEQIHDQLAPQQQEMLRAIEVSGRTQLALVNDILDLSKIGAGKFEIDCHDFDLRQLVQDVNDIFALRARSESIDFQIDLQGELPDRQFLGDRKSMGQVLINLLSNAFKFTEQGAVQLNITIDSKQKMLHFEVKDEGIGMSADALDRLFQPFEQADRSIARRFGGTGLGMHISWSLVELMHGSIQVESEEGRGSTFTVIIPYQLGEFPLEDEELVQSQAEAGEGHFKGRVLIAEDTPDLQALERNLLESIGLEVELASNGEEAFSRAMEQEFDLVLMDMQMPVMDGVEATRMLREVNNSTPVVALTANVMQRHKEEFLQAGCDDFLSKPIDRTALMGVLRKFLPQFDGEAVEEEGTFVVDASDELMVLFVERVAEIALELEEAMEQEALPQLYALSHIVKGNAATFGYPEVSRLAAAVSDAVQSEDRELALQLAAELLDNLGEISGEI